VPSGPGQARGRLAWIRWGNVVLYQLSDQNALDNEARAVRRKGTGWAGVWGAGVVGRAPDRIVV
jgi:hypothetical protein